MRIDAVEILFELKLVMIRSSVSTGNSIVGLEGQTRCLTGVLDGSRVITEILPWMRRVSTLSDCNKALGVAKHAPELQYPGGQKWQFSLKRNTTTMPRLLNDTSF
jgi:hypothetical protein